MLFMPAGSRIIELRKTDPRSADCFSNMASALGHEFNCQLCPAQNGTEAPYTADLIIDTELLIGALRQFLGEV